MELTSLLLGKYNNHVGKNGEHFYGETFIYEYPTKRHLKSNQHMDILHAVSNCPTKRHIKLNQHMGILHAFSNCARATINHGLSPQKLTGVIPKENLQNIDSASWKLTGKEKCSTTYQVDAFSWKVTGEATSESTLGKDKPTITTPQLDPSSWKSTGEANSEPTLWLTEELMKLTHMDTA